MCRCKYSLLCTVSMGSLGTRGRNEAIIGHNGYNIGDHYVHRNHCHVSIDIALSP